MTLGVMVAMASDNKKIALYNIYFYRVYNTELERHDGNVFQRTAEDSPSLKMSRL